MDVSRLSNDDLDFELEKQLDAKDPSELSDEELDALIEIKQNKKSTLQDAVTGLQAGATLGLRPTIAGLAGGAGAGIQTLRDTGSLSKAFSSAGEAFTEARQDAKREQRLAQRNSPWAYGAANLGGSLLIPGAAFKPFIAGQKGIDAAARIGLTVGAADALGSADNVAEGLEKTALGGAAGVAGDLLIKGAAKGVQSLKTPAKKALATFLGPNEKAIEAYLKDPKAINSAKSLEEIKTRVDDVISRLNSDVEQGKLSVKDAKDKLSEIQRRILDHKKESNFNYQVTKTDISQSLRQAKNDLDKAYGSQVQNLKDIKAPLNMADEVTEAVRDLKTQIGDESKKAYEILGKQRGEVDLNKNVQQVLLNKLDEMKIAGQLPPTPQGRKAYSEIVALSDYMFKLPAKVSFQDAKRLIQAIDRSEQAVYNSAEFTDDVQQAYKAVRRSLDQDLKTKSVEYSKQMDKVAGLTRLHSELAPAFGDKSAALARLNRIGGDIQGPEREALKKLGQVTGRDFGSPVDRFLAAQRTLKSPAELEAMRANLPESAAHDELLKAKGMLEGPSAQREFVENNLAASGLLDDEAKALEALSGQEAALSKAESASDPFRGITEGTSESKLKGLMRAKPGEQIELKDQFQQLSKLSDFDFERAVNELRTKEAFSGQRINGSRNVNLFALVAHGAGGALGGAMVGGPAGAAGGAVLGGIVDYFGPAISKKILDGVIKMQGSPSIQKIQSLKLPPQAKAYLIKMLAEYAGEAQPDKNQAALRMISEKYGGQ